MQRIQHVVSTPPKLPTPTNFGPHASEDLPVSIGSLDFGGHNVGRIGSFNGVPFFSTEGCKWIWARTGREPSFPLPFMNSVPWQRADPPWTAAASEGCQLPDRRVVELYYSAFRSSSFRFAFPLLDDRIYNEAVGLAFDPQCEQSTPAAVAGAKACILSFLGVMILMEGKLDGLPPLDAEKCIAKANQTVLGILQDTSVMALHIHFMQVGGSEDSVTAVSTLKH